LGKHDDQVDASSGAFNRLATIPEYGLPQTFASGENPDEESKRFSDEEIGELPDFMRELITETRKVVAERRTSA
jgi:hypothetical protein